MLSLYIHIPFCRHKCTYCSFFVMPEDKLETWSLEEQKNTYLKTLKQEIMQRVEQYGSQPIRTIYIWGGTPFQLGAERLEALIDFLLEQWDTEFLEELTIELNPDPIPEVLEFIAMLGKKYTKLYRVRVSLWMQSFDDTMLKATKRQYTFTQLQWFLRALPKLKKANLSFNGDFIAFWKSETQQSDHSQQQRDFIYKLVHSGLFDWFSVYTLEVLPGSDRYNQSMHTAKAIQTVYGDDDQIIDEFLHYAQILENAWYRRYELSNFAKRGHDSIHNTVYRTGGSFLGLWINASSYLNAKTIDRCWTPRGLSELSEFPSEATQPVRYKNTHKWKEYLKKQRIDTTNWEVITPNEQLREEAMLRLRTFKTLALANYTAILEPTAHDQIWSLASSGHLQYDATNNTIRLTHSWMTLYNTIITELFTIS